LGSLLSQAQFSPVQGALQAASVRQVPKLPGMPPGMPQQINPASQADCVPVVQVQPSALQGGGSSSHCCEALQ
jgi:hypothetical protein